MIWLNNVAKTYDTGGAPVHALRDIDLQVAEGEFVAIMGPSGSGKSTLLTMLGCMNPPSVGRLLIDEIDVYALSQERQADFRHAYVGFVFQQLQLMPYLTALQNIMLGLVIAPMRRAEKMSRARDALERVGLADKAHRLPYQLSGGEQGRVAVARAIVNEPPVILADEPSGSLDRATGAQVLEQLSALHGAGHTVVMVTHDPQAAAYAGRLVTILDGRIAEETAATIALPQPAEEAH
jgi:putative ABC transport system ATP-binding protein